MSKLETLYSKWKALQPLSTRKQHLLGRRFMVEYNYNSNHIAGNTLSYGQTELLLLFGKVSGEGIILVLFQNNHLMCGGMMVKELCLEVCRAIRFL